MCHEQVSSQKKADSIQQNSDFKKRFARVFSLSANVMILLFSFSFISYFMLF